MNAIRLLSLLIFSTCVTPVLAQQSPSPFRPVEANAAAPGVGQQGTSQPNRIVKNLRNFLIPFELAANAQEVHEVHLHLSTDQGKNWQLFQRQAPSNKNFPFRAATDGEYWFAVRTVGRQPDPTRPLNLQPELIVVVDTQSPRLNLRLQATTGATCKAEWYAEDEHLLVDSFKLQFQDHLGQWQTIPFDKPSPATSTMSTHWQSQTAWRPHVRGSDLLVRAEVFDHAGNSQVVQKRLTVNGTPPNSWDRGIGDQVAGQGETESDRIGPNWEDLESRFRDGSGAFWPGPDTDGPSTTHGKEAIDWGNREPRDSPISQAPTDQGNRWNTFDQREDPWQEFDSLERTRTMTGRIEQSVGQQQRANVDKNFTDEPVFHPRISATPNFELVYDVYGVQPNEGRLVELWYTRDRGRSWELYGRDPDQQSPMSVRVQAEGLYGFQLTIDTGRGQAPVPPRPGAEPDVWVIVDWTKPTAQINRVVVPGDAASRDITIEWTAHDTGLLADAPISLSYADSPHGPWTYIVKNISNSGVYYWRFDRRLPQDLFFRLEARDVVGNVAAHVYDGLGGPRSRIVDVRPGE